VNFAQDFTRDTLLTGDERSIELRDPWWQVTLVSLGGPRTIVKRDGEGQWLLPDGSALGAQLAAGQSEGSKRRDLPTMIPIFGEIAGDQGLEIRGIDSGSAAGSRWAHGTWPRPSPSWDHPVAIIIFRRRRSPGWLLPSFLHCATAL